MKKELQNLTEKAAHFLSVALMIVMLAGFSTPLFAQPASMSVNQDVSGTYTNTTMTLKGGVFQARFQENGSGTSAGTRNWQFNTDGYFNTWGVKSTNGASTVNLSAYNTTIQPNAATASGNFEGGPGYNNKGRLPATQANYYYTYNLMKGSSYADQLMSVLETSYNPVTLSSVAQSGGTFGGRTVTITTSGTPNASENIYVRYSTNNFSTSALVLATGSGTTWTATIPWQSAAVSFYVYSSPRTLSAINADVTANGQQVHDTSMLNLNNNSGSNYSWTPATGAIIVSSTGGTGSAGTGYSTFTTTTTGVFAALNGGAVHTGTVTVLITADVTTEPGSVALNNSAAWTAMTVNPSGARTVSGTLVGAPLFDFNGADNVTVNGLNSGGNSLTISNLSTSSTSGTSTIRFQADATSNTITNCSVLGSSTMPVGTNGGNIWFGSGATTTGNDTNTISSCNIGPAGGNLPSKGIYFSGTTTTTTLNNSGNTITSNNIFDIFNGGVESAGIYSTTGATANIFTNNKFYQTATRTFTTTVLHSAIKVTNTTSAAGFTITGNTIGFASNTGTGVYTLTGSTGRFAGIVFNGLNGGTVSNIDSNTIAGISMTGVTSSGTTTSSPFTGILINEGVTTCNTNIIGSQSTTGSIVFSTNTTTGTDIYGILNFGSNLWTSNSNQIGSMTITNAGASGAFIVYGIRCWTGSGVTWIASSNLVGGTVANSIQNNCTSTTAQLIGMNGNAPASTLTNNTVRNLVATGGTGTSTTASVIGISSTGTSASHTLTSNTIYTLSNTNTTAASNVAGILFGGSTANTVERNFMYDLTATTNSASAEISGIKVSAGTTTFKNNMIAIGAGVSNAIQINGISEPSSTGTDNFYNNSVYIGGTVTAGTANSFAFNSTQTTVTRAFRNNIFVNARSNSGATGKNYIVRVGGTTVNPGGLTINNNIYYGTGTGSVFGFFNSLDVANLGAWQTAVGQDAASLYGDPKYISPAGGAPDLHISAVLVTPAEGTGAAIAGVTDDYDGQTRSGLTPTDIGADAGNFTTGDFTAPTISYTTLTNTTSTANRTLATVTIADAVGVPTAGALQPRIYFRKNAGTWFSTQGTLMTGTGTSGTWDFIIDNSLMGGVAISDVIQYYVIAQDAAANITTNPSGGAASDVNTVTSAPTANSYLIVSTPLSGTYTVGSGGSFATITAAVAQFNAAGVSGPVVFSLTDASYGSETFPITIGAPAGVSAVNTLTIRPATGVNVAITGSSATALFTMNGADYVIIDGSNNPVTNTICPAVTSSRNLTLTNTNTGTTSAVVWLQTNAADGATNNIVRNANILGSGNTQTLFGIGSGSSTISTTSLGTGNNNNTIENNNISKTQYGIYSAGASAASKNSGTVINQNLINTASPDNVLKTGITAAFENNLTISGNNVANMNFTSGDTAGISVGYVIASAFSTTSFGTQEASNVTIANNVVNNVVNTGAFSAVAIAVGQSATGTTNINNNAVLAINSNGTSGDFGAGIFINSAAGSTLNVYFNSVYMSGGTTASVVTAGGNYAMAIGGSGAGTATNVRNNIFENTTTTNMNGYTVGIAYSTFTGLTLGNNNYFKPATGNFIYGRTGGLNSGTNVTTVPIIAGETGSITTDPLYNSTTNLVLQIGSPAVGAGASGLGITTDIVCAARAGSPSLGAYETPSDLSGPTINYTPLASACTGGARTLTATISDPSNVGTGAGLPVAYYKINNGTYTAATGTFVSGNTYNFSIGTGSVSGDVVSYYIVAQDQNGTINVSAFPAAGATGFTANPPAASTPPTTPSSYTVNYTLNGTYTVGTGGTFVTLTAAVAAYNGGCSITGPVVFSLTDATYASETYPITINSNAGANATNTLTIKPTQANTVFTGTSSSALVVINGADYVTIDGSTSATANTVCPASAASRNITFTNNSTSTTSAVIWLQTATGDGATNNTVKNCNLTGSGNTQTLFGVGSGSSSISASSSGTGNNSNSFVNNNISKTKNGIYSKGLSAANKNTGTIINQNVITAASPNNIATAGILVGFENGITVSGNNIGNVQSPDDDAFGIALGGTAISTTTFTGNEVINATVTNNTIGIIRGADTFSSIGVYIPTTTNTGTTLIANNMISGANSNGTSPDLGAGIFLGNVVGTVNVFYNTITVTGSVWTSTATWPSLGLASTSAATVLNIRNNIFTSTGSTGANLNRAMGFAYNTFTNLTSDNNDLFANGTGAAVVQTVTLTNAGATSYTNLSGAGSWNAFSGKDGNSVSYLPTFTSATDLHINNTVAANSTSLNAKAAVVSVTTDFDCATRDAATPDIGADEFVGCTVPTSFSYTTSTVVACTNNAIAANNPSFTGSAATSYSILPALPSGLSLNTSTGVISGTPTVAAAAANYTITVNNTCGSTTAVVNLTVNSPVDYANLQYPATGHICTSGNFDAYGQVYKSGVTEAAGQGAGIIAELGYSTSNTDPATWTNWIAATFNTQSGNNDEYIANLSGLSSGTYYYTFRYHTNSCNYQYGGYSAGGGNFWDGVTYVSGVLTVDPASVGGAVTGGTAICQGSTSGLLTLGTHTGTIVRWESSVSPFTTWTPIANTASTYTSGTLTQTTEFRAVVQSGLCSEANSTPTTVTVDPASVGGSVAGGTTICSGSTSGLLTLSGNTGTIVRWESSVSPFTTWSPIANIASTYTSGTLTQTTQFRAVVQSGACAEANSTSTTVTVDPASNGGTVLGGTTICSGSTSGLLTLSGETGTIVRWESSVSPFTTWSPIANITNTYTSGALTQTTQFRAVVQNGACGEANAAAATVTVSPASVGGTVSGGSTTCNGSSSVLTLSGHTGAVVRWESSVSPFTTWSPIAHTGTTYMTGPITVETHFRAVVQSGPCASATSSETIVTVGGNTTTWSAGAWSNGTPNSLSAAIINGNFTAVADLNACTLTIQSGTVTVSGGFDFYVNGKVTVSGGSLTFEDGSDLVQSQDIANTGNIKYKRTANLIRQDYVYWSSPVSGQLLQPFSPNTLNTRFYNLDEPTNAFVQIASPSTTSFDAAKGYMIRSANNHPTTLTPWTGTFTGVPRNGEYTIPVTVSGQGYNMIGNPYPSTVDADLFLAEPGNAGTLYFWTHISQAAASGANYATYNTLGGTAAQSGGTAPTGAIRGGQGFILLKSSASTAKFTNAMRTAEGGAFYRSAQTAEKHRMWFNLNTPAHAMNQILVGYAEGATMGEDVAMDGRSIEGGSSISSLIGNDNYVIQARPLPFVDTDVVPLGFNAATAGTYIIELDHMDGLFSGDQNVYLKDNLLGVTHNIKQGAYSFASAEGSFANRFEVVYQSSPLGVDTPTFDANSVVVYKDQGMLHINSGKVVMSGVKIFDIRGRLIYERGAINASEAVLNDLRAEEQVLLVQITSVDNEVVTRKVAY
ncbi:hypothetical protein [Flavobacterium pallidum]|uniref:Secretion system C-terminal sorting domain-containing protein n=1 Tax=Flavobacterium pallidum TaxID=2172098 RepID=A0A2S1SGV2_9FLAO|nr:hypothetical protein [Flavobacterium pallidum]AWI25646.1 hypothetical protein HYN49_06900 [Flavobacterium pallidum]